MNARSSKREQALPGDQLASEEITVARPRWRERLAARLLESFASSRPVADVTVGVLEALAEETGLGSVGLRLFERAPGASSARSGSSPCPCAGPLSKAHARRRVWVEDSAHPGDCLCGRLLAQNAQGRSRLMTEGGSFFTAGLTKWLRSPESVEVGAAGLRKSARKFETLALIPVRFRAHRFGLLQLADARAGALHRGDIEHLERVATALAMAMHACQVSDVQQRAPGEMLDRGKTDGGLQRLADESPIYIVLLDLEGRIVELNRAAAKTLGVGSHEVAGADWCDSFLPAKESARVRAQLEALKSPTGRAEAQLEASILSADGSERTLLWHLAVLRDERGKPWGIIGSGLDITERNVAAKALVASEQNLRALFDGMVEGVLYQAVNGDVLDANRAACALFGSSLRELRGSNPVGSQWRIVSEDGRPMEPERWPSLEAARTGRPVRNRTLGYFNPGQEGFVWLRVNATPDHATGAAEVERVLVTLHDITDLRQAQRVLRESEERFEKAFRAAPLLLTLSRVDTGEYVEVNDQFCRVSGYERNACLGKTATDLGWMTAEQHELLMMLLRQSGRVANLEMPLRARDGREVNCLQSGELVSVGERLLLLSIGLDVAEWNLAAEASS